MKVKMMSQVSYKVTEPVGEVGKPSDEDMKLINGLKQNGPLRKLNPDEVNVRTIYIMGEDPTTKKSIHPEGKINGKVVNVLSRLAKLLPGVPMMDGHKYEGRVPWGRVFASSVVEGVKGIAGKVCAARFYFLNSGKGAEIAQEIDAGIRSEGSIAYGFGKARCSVCHSEVRVLNLFGMILTSFTCKHKIGEKAETGEDVYWYPDPSSISFVAEVSHVFRGAYGKTRMVYDDVENEEFKLGDSLANGMSESDEKLLAEKLNVAGSEAELVKNGFNVEQAKRVYELVKSGRGVMESISEVMSAGGLPPKAGPEPVQPDSGKSAAVENRVVTCESCGNEVELKPENLIEGKPGVWECSSCGAEIDRDGKSVEVEFMPGESANAAEPSLVECPACKKKVDGKSGKCPECGAELSLPVPKSGPVDPEKNPDKPDDVSIPNAAMIKCPKCGAEITGSPDVCPKCGEKLAAELKKADEPKPGEKSSSVKPGESKDEEVVCHACSHRFVHSSVSGSGMGYVKCPGCGVMLNQNGWVVGNSKAELFKPFGPMKPSKSGAVNNEFFEKDGFRDLQGEYYLEPKYDGVWMELHRSGDKVALFTDEGNDQAEKFPNVKAESMAGKSDHFVVAGEMVKYKGRQRLGHEDVSGYIHSKGPYEDYHFRFKVYDVMVADGKDVRELPLSERKAMLERIIGNTDHIHKVKSERVSGGKEVVAGIESMSSREGTMIKLASGKYGKDGEKDLYKWKRQAELDVLVTDKKDRDGGGWVYTCAVGRGDEQQEIGETYTTSVDAKKGDILQVSVDKVTYDEASKKFTWTAPKVMALREDKKEPDPISTVKKISVLKGEGELDKKGEPGQKPEPAVPAGEKPQEAAKESKKEPEPVSVPVPAETPAGPQKNSVPVRILLGDVIPKLKSMSRDYSIWLVGGVVEKGYSDHDLDMITTFDPSPEQRNAVKAALGDELYSRVDWAFDVMGPKGPSLEINSDMSVEALAAWKFGNKFVIQKHWWGDKAHWDIRFGAPRTPRMWGWTCFKEPPKTSDGEKVMCAEKMYHDPKWMKVGVSGAEAIKPGDPGNPTKNHTAYMKVLDQGGYTFVVRKPKFMEVELRGDKYKGRYVFREIQVKGKRGSSEPAAYPDEAGEGKAKNDRIWIMWRPKDQVIGGKVHKLAVRVSGNNFFYWEQNEVDTDVMEMLKEGKDV